jgi:hypothetical protein
MQEQELLKTLAVYATPLLLAVITFFLKALLSRFSDLEKEVKAMLIKHEGFEARILALEHRIKEFGEQMWEVLKNQ